MVYVDETEKITTEKNRQWTCDDRQNRDVNMQNSIKSGMKIHLKLKRAELKKLENQFVAAKLEYRKNEKRDPRFDLNTLSKMPF